ncbi:MAG: hypothetical protein FWG34_05750 [Oscillospiraceae bacterium]|jgi:uncharacterized protein YxeA|nr:hypothetical protein [Oscillospiraceae bacterium]
MKRIICIFMATALLFLLISCSGGDADDKGDAASNSAAEGETKNEDEKKAEEPPEIAAQEEKNEPAEEPAEPAEPIGSCEFVGMDKDTGGEWVGAYGGEGYIVLSRDDDYNPPAYASVEFLNYDENEPPHHVWYQESETDEEDLEEDALENVIRRKPGTLYTDPSKTDRAGSCFYDGSWLYVNIDVGGETKYVTLYSLDYDEQGRETSITVYDGNGKIKLVDAIEISEFSGGVYVKFKVSGKISIEYENLTSGQNAVVGAVFFDGI